MTLLHFLKERQRTDKLSDIAFAKKLGIPRSTWNKVRNGERGIGGKTLQRILQVYPEAVVFLAPNAPNVTKEGTTQNDCKPNIKSRLKRLVGRG